VPEFFALLAGGCAHCEHTENDSDSILYKSNLFLRNWRNESALVGIE
jgi:hypothetical protein